MEIMEEEESSQIDPTQPTQTVFDPRREGKQNSGFPDDVISDIICELIPTSPAAKFELANMAKLGAPYVSLYASRFPQEDNRYSLVLRLSDVVKTPRLGFVFGRNRSTSDICFVVDPRKRISNQHFQIYVNEWGHVMLESQSTNGTHVDDRLLNKSTVERKRMIITGTKVRVPMHEPQYHIEFVVRIPQRQGDHSDAYAAKVEAYLRRQKGGGDDTTIAPDVNGRIDAFGAPAPGPPGRAGSGSIKKSAVSVSQEWTGHPDYHKVGPIGRGAFASVYRVTRRLDGQPFAAKELDTQRFIKNGVLDARVDNEMRIMSSVKHPYIVQYTEHFLWEKLMIIIMELVPFGDVGKYIVENGPMDEPLAQTLVRQMLDALAHLHELGITHRDIKPDNILIKSIDPPEFKLTDFGLSKMVTNEQTFLRTFCGTLLYCAPEVYAEYTEYDEKGFRSLPRARLVARPRYDHLVDVWSLGAVLYYCLTKDPPFHANLSSHTELLHEIMTTNVDTEPLVSRRVSEAGVNFIRLMLQRRPEHRPDVKTLQQHLWLGAESSPQEKPSPDALSDDEEGLQIGASQLSLQDGESGLDDDRDCDGRDQHDQYLDDDRKDGDEMDSDDPGGGDASSRDPIFHDSSLDATPQRAPQTPSRQDLGPILFGEVDISAIDSSGVVPDHQLNADTAAAAASESFETEIIDDDDDDDDDEGDSDLDDYTVVRPPMTGSRFRSLSRGQSMDQLRSLVMEVYSQDLNKQNKHSGGNKGIEELGELGELGDTEHNVPNGGESFDMVSRSDTASADHGYQPPPQGSDSRILFTANYNSSKRKDPPPYGAGDDASGDPRQSQTTTIKRIKAGSSSSTGPLLAEPLTEEALKEYQLLASIPSRRLDYYTRLIDDPISKTTFWESRKLRTWHLNYPEMTYLQYEAFQTAAMEHGYEFAPKKSPYWKLAMRYFPPTKGSLAPPAPPAPLAASPAPGVPKDGLPPPDQAPGTAKSQTPVAVPVPVPDDDPNNQPLAWLTPMTGSVVDTISLTVRDSMMSWGRGPENTNVYKPISDDRVPKYGFRILLWGEGYDPSKRSTRPWRNPHGNADSLSFFISTKATGGIIIDDFKLDSHGALRPLTRAVNWVQLFDGDVIYIWGNRDSPKGYTALEFRCRWGGSSRRRPADQPPQLAPEAVVRKLDSIYFKLEDRLLTCRNLKRLQAVENADLHRRRANIELERERSCVFEERCREAAAYLETIAAKVPPGSRFGPAATPTLLMHGGGHAVGRGLGAGMLPSPVE